MLQAVWLELPAKDRGSTWALVSTDVEWKRQACRGVWSSQHSNIKTWLIQPRQVSDGVMWCSEFQE